MNFRQDQTFWNGLSSAKIIYFCQNQIHGKGYRQNQTEKLLLLGFLCVSCLISAFGKFYECWIDVIFHSAICCLTFFIPIVRPYLAHSLWQRITPHLQSWNWAYGVCDRSAGDVYSSLAPYPTSDVSRGPLYPRLSCGLFQVLDLDTAFDCRFFCIPELDTLILTTDICVWNRALVGYDWSTRDAFSSLSPDPTAGIPRGLC
jgi:hypothetical protein